MGSLRVGSLNINGGRDRKKRVLTYDYMRQKGVNVILLQETHSDIENEVRWGTEWEGEFVLSHGTNTSAGIAVMFSQGLGVRVIVKEEVEKGRALIVQAEVHGYMLIFVNVYAPNRGPDRVRLFAKLAQSLEKYDQNMLLVLGGDWNCTADFVGLCF